MSFTLVDVDAQALQYVRERLIRGVWSRWFAERRNLLHLCIGRQQLELEPQHLIYSSALLITSTTHRDAIADVDLLLLGLWRAFNSRQFHTSNPTRGLMDHLLDWRLIHRDEADMLRLAQAAGFAPDATQCCFESAGVNLFSVSHANQPGLTRVC
ncbi:MAG: hypothetical protein CM15mP38_3050 [Synechococcus sp.]|nr:MAG: hypothetical protein CM15mP38_3050 [Synechococcus sp.]